MAIPLANPFFRIAVAAGVINSRRSLYTDGQPDDRNGSLYPPPFDWIPQALGEDLHTEVGAMRIGNDHIGYQIPFDKWDDSCHTCFPYLLTDDDDSCPIHPIDCSTVFRDNVGQQVDPIVSEALSELLNELHGDFPLYPLWAAPPYDREGSLLCCGSSRAPLR